MTKTTNKESKAKKMVEDKNQPPKKKAGRPKKKQSADTAELSPEVATISETPEEDQQVKSKGRGRKKTAEQKEQPEQPQENTEAVILDVKELQNLLEIAVKERDAARQVIEKLQKEIEELKALYEPDEHIDNPKKGTTYWYVRDSLCPESFQVLQQEWTGSFWDKCRFIKGNYFLDIKSANLAAQQLENELDKRWGR